MDRCISPRLLFDFRKASYRISTGTAGDDGPSDSQATLERNALPHCLLHVPDMQGTLPVNKAYPMR